MAADSSAIGSLSAVQVREIFWDFAFPSAMKSFEGALIRRADVLLEV